MITVKSRLAVAAWAMAVLLAPVARDAAAAGDDYFWRLGVGTYGTPGPKAPEDEVLTHARFDWQMIAFGSGVDMPTINRCLEMNPRQRFLVRLWPRQGGDNFLAYLYKPGVRERIHQAVADQVNQVLNEITRPDQVLAFTFLEELPDHWHPCWQAKDDAGALAMLSPYRAAIEKELDGPLVYDDAQKAWLWRKFAESLDGIHGAIRAAAGPDRLVLYWARYYGTPDDVLGRIVRPGGADGLFLYVLRPDQWSRQVAMAEMNRWPFFAQLSHNTLMKQSDWKTCAELPHVKSLCNLGYFFYDSGNALRPHAFDNPAVAHVNNVRGLSEPVHLRGFAAERNLGWDIFKNHLRLIPRIDFRPEGKRPGDRVDLYVMVPNPILEGHFPDEANRRIQGVSATLALPPWLQSESESVKLDLGDLGPSRHRAPAPGSIATGRWRLKVVAPPADGTAVAVSVSGTHPILGTVTGRAEVAGCKDHALPVLEEQSILVSGQGWLEPGFGLKQDVGPTIVMRTGARAVSKPSLTDHDLAVEVSLGSYTNNAAFYRLRPVDSTNGALNRLVFDGEIPPYSTLTLRPGGRATLAPTRPLFEKTFADEASPGAGASAGYYLGANGVNRPVPVGEKVAITVFGKKQGNVNSLLLVYFRNADTGERRGMSDGLVNRFGTEWTRVHAELAPPFTNAILDSIALYRFPRNATGTVWYGSIQADLVAGPSAERDVSASVRGVPPLLRAGHVTTITYFDEDTHQPEGNKISVRLSSGTLP